MKRLVIDAMADAWYGEEMIKKALEQSETKYIRLREHTFKHCGCCEGCGKGKCVHRDIMDEVIHGYANSDEIYFVTPIKFGSYSTLLTKAVNRMLPMASPLYKMKGGYMIHPCRYPNKRLIGIGWVTMGQEGEDASFKNLLEHNARNFECTQVKAMSFKAEEELHKMLARHVEDREEDWTWVFKK